MKYDPSTIVKTESAILKVLGYFDIFHYPITASEIKQFNNYLITDEQFHLAVDRLLNAGTIFRFDEFYCLENNYSRVKNRLRGNAKAEKIFPKAKKIGRFLYQFPFISGVAISGSLSKNFADEDGDIDFFLMTKTNRLWIARTFMHVFKKFTYLIGKQHSFCMNYYVDETALAIGEKNIYTATEIKTLLPVAGSTTIKDFFLVNAWADDWLPYFQPDLRSLKENRPVIKKITEWLLDNRFGDKLDDYFFSLTTRRWRKKEQAGKKNMKGRTMNLLTGKHFAKSNPDFYQEKIIETYHSKIAAIKNKWPEFISDQSFF